MRRSLRAIEDDTEDTVTAKGLDSRLHVTEWRLTSADDEQYAIRCAGHEMGVGVGAERGRIDEYPVELSGKVCEQGAQGVRRQHLEGVAVGTARGKKREIRRDHDRPARGRRCAQTFIEAVIVGDAEERMQGRTSEIRVDDEDALAAGSAQRQREVGHGKRLAFVGKGAGHEQRRHGPRAADRMKLRCEALVGAAGVERIAREDQLAGRLARLALRRDRLLRHLAFFSLHTPGRFCRHRCHSSPSDLDCAVLPCEEDRDYE